MLHATNKLSITFRASYPQIHEAAIRELAGLARLRTKASSRFETQIWNLRRLARPALAGDWKKRTEHINRLKLFLKQAIT
jgi:hypothetical protein